MTIETVAAASKPESVGIDDVDRPEFEHAPSCRRESVRTLHGSVSPRDRCDGEVHAVGSGYGVTELEQRGPPTGAVDDLEIDPSGLPGRDLWRRQPSGDCNATRSHATKKQGQDWRRKGGNSDDEKLDRPEQAPGHDERWPDG